jgi:signal transduction histidine kinase
MSMSDRLEPAALKKRLKALEAQASEAQRTIDDLKSHDALKTQFLSNISHDLRTPLAAIITHAEILREGMLGELNPKQRDSIGGIVNGGQQLLDMIDEILSYVRGASGSASPAAAATRRSSSSKSATPGVESRATTMSLYSASSRRWMRLRRARTTEPASDWLSHASSWSSTRERSGWRASLAKEAGSFLRCPSTLPGIKCAS